MKKTSSSEAPSRGSPSHLNIYGKFDVDLHRTVQFLKNNGVNVTVRNEEVPPTFPIVVGKGQEKPSSKGKQHMRSEALANKKGKALIINSPTNMQHKPPTSMYTMGKGKEKAFSNDLSANKRQRTDGCGVANGKENIDSNKVSNVSNKALGQQHRRAKERLEGLIRPLPLCDLTPTKYVIAQRRRREIEILNNGIDLQAPSKQAKVMALSSLLIGDLETPNRAEQLNIREKTPLKTHGKQSNPQQPTRNSMLGNLLSPRNLSGELLNMVITENETIQLQPPSPMVCGMAEDNMPIIEEENLLLHTIIQVQPSSPTVPTVLDNLPQENMPNVSEQNLDAHVENLEAHVEKLEAHVEADDMMHEIGEVIRPQGRNFLGKMDVACQYCGALHWMAEKVVKSPMRNPQFGTCCKHGKIRLPLLFEPPLMIRSLFDENNNLSKALLNNIREYNAANAFTSLGFTMEPRVLTGRGPYNFIIHGELRHRTGDLVPEEGKEGMYAQLYIYDSASALESRQRRNPRLKREVLQVIQDTLLENNAFVHKYRQAHKLLNQANLQGQNVPAYLHYSSNKDHRRYNLPSTDEIAVILPGEGTELSGTKDIVVHLKGNLGLMQINECHPAYLPLHYVLLFPYGELGWESNLSQWDVVRNVPHHKDRITQMQFYSFRIFQRLTEYSTILRGRKLFQEFLVDAWAATEQNCLRYCRFHQNDFRVELYKDLAELQDEGWSKTDVRIPSVVRLSLHLEGQHRVVYDPTELIESIRFRAEEEKSKLVAFLDCCKFDVAARAFTYLEFPQHYTWQKSGIWTPRGGGYAIGRMYFASPNSGERFYLRLLLLNVKGPQSWKDLRTVDNTLHDTFKSACVARGLLEDDEEWVQCLQEAAFMKTGYQLRRLFGVILTQCFPINPDQLWNRFALNICDDLAYKIQTTFGIPSPTDSEVTDYGLHLLDQVLYESGKGLSDFPPMPLPIKDWNVITGNRLIWEHRQLQYAAQRPDALLNVDR